MFSDDFLETLLHPFSYNCRCSLYSNYYRNLSFTMRLTTAERDKRLAEAIDYYNSHNGSISARKVAAKFEVSRTRRV